MLDESQASRNKIAMICLGAAKIFGIVGICLAYNEVKILGGIFLLLDAILLGITIYMCSKNLKDQNIEEKTEKKTLEKMIREGTLYQYMKDINEAKL